MVRLIDADAVLKWFDEYWAMQKKLGRPSKQQRAIYMTMRTMVNSRKTEDAVPVVRCKDCIRWRRSKSDTTAMVCDWDAYEKTENDYCSWAKRKEDADI